ncbi:MAG: RNA polymerase sigma factor [Planctomycetota bacterium]
MCRGDRKAFEEFVNEYQHLVFLCCRTLGLDADEAEDVASETFLAAYQKLRGFRGTSKLSTFLWKIAYYKAIDYIRKNKNNNELIGEVDEQFPDRNFVKTVAEIENKEQSEAIWLAVKQLPSLWSMAVVLFYRENKSIEEISKIMEKRKNTIKIYLFRSRKRLQKLLANFSGEE